MLTFALALASLVQKECPTTLENARAVRVGQKKLFQRIFPIPFHTWITKLLKILRGFSVSPLLPIYIHLAYSDMRRSCQCPGDAVSNVRVVEYQASASCATFINQPSPVFAAGL
jgi:hypothetical protein